MRRIFDDVRALEAAIEESRDKPRGLLRVTAPVVLGQIRILPVIVAFRAEFPNVRVDLILADRVVDVIEERIDMLITQKKELAERIVGTGERWITELNTAQLRELVTLSQEAVAA